MLNRIKQKLRIRTRIVNLIEIVRVFGLIDGIKSRLLGMTLPYKKKYYFRPKGGGPRLCVRAGTSDFDVYLQIFGFGEYSPLTTLKNVRFIFDLGSNVGFSSFYFLRTFSEAKVFSVEPDSENFAMMAENLDAYKHRYKGINGAVWTENVFLSLLQTYRDGVECSRQVEVQKCKDDLFVMENRVQGYEMKTLLEMSKFDKIDILKVDIEGSEAYLFGKGDLGWIDKVMNIAIELHDDSYFGNASKVFFSALEGKSFIFEKSGELIIGKKNNTTFNDNINIS